jgi:hypothetical protein
MRPMDPSGITDPHILATSVNKVMRANVSKGSGATFDGAGNPTTFFQDNTDEVMIRVGPGLANTWAASNTDTTITHNLGRKPIGYYITKKSKTCDVYDGSVVATKTQITLRITDSTADTVLAIF